MTPSKFKAQKQLTLLEEAAKKEKIISSLNKNHDGHLDNMPIELEQKKIIITDVNVCKYDLFKAPWKELINIGEMYSLRDYRVRSDVLRLKSSLGFTYVRFWNVLSDKMLTGQYISDDPRAYNFSIINESIDFLLQNQLTPFFQMGYKVIKPSSEGVDGVKTSRTYIKTLFSFTTLDELCKMLRILLEHLIRRYGANEVNSWVFEVWHPQLYYKLPDDWVIQDNEEFSIAVYKVLHNMLPNARIGGAEYVVAFGKEKIRSQMLRFKNAGCSFDFISCVSYPYQIGVEATPETMKWLADESYVIDEITTLRNLMDEIGDNDKPIYLTEYNITVSHRNFLNDTYFKGAYILKNMFDITQAVQAAGYWLLSDIYSESKETGDIVYGGNGLISKDGIFKPAYYALYFLAKSKDYIIESGSNYLITTNGRNDYTIIIHNMQKLNHLAFLMKEENITIDNVDKVFEDNGAIQLELQMHNINYGQYRVKRYLIDDNHGNILGLWNHNGRLADYMNEELAFFKNACAPDMTIQILSSKDDKTLTLSEVLEPNCFSCYELNLIEEY